MSVLNGPSKYDALLTAARLGAKADGAILIVFGGELGDGFAVQAPLPIVLQLPKILREMADKVELQQASRLL